MSTRADAPELRWLRSEYFKANMRQVDCLNREFHQRLLKRVGWAFEIRPMLLGSFFVQLLAPTDRRRIISTADGLRLYLDPFSHLGREILTTGVYEPETTSIFRQQVKEGHAVLDIGANEGVFSALAASIVGDRGLVLALEPQSRLRDLLEINLRLNGPTRFLIYQKAFGRENDERLRLNLFPPLNTGASSLIRGYRLWKHFEEVEFISFSSILQESGRQRIDFIKVDVEGFEHQVIKQLLPFIRTGNIGKILLDYHKELLRSQGKDPLELHTLLTGEGMQAIRGDVESLSSYVLYENTRI
jgi:FkbM family methyltransferase